MNDYRKRVEEILARVDDWDVMPSDVAAATNALLALIREAQLDAIGGDDEPLDEKLIERNELRAEQRRQIKEAHNQSYHPESEDDTGVTSKIEDELSTKKS